MQMSSALSFSAKRTKNKNFRCSDFSLSNRWIGEFLWEKCNDWWWMKHWWRDGFKTLIKESKSNTSRTVRVELSAKMQTHVCLPRQMKNIKLPELSFIRLLFPSCPHHTFPVITQAKAKVFFLKSDKKKVWDDMHAEAYNPTRWPAHKVIASGHTIVITF